MFYAAALRCGQHSGRKRPEVSHQILDTLNIHFDFNQCVSVGFGRAVKTLVTGPEVSLPKPYTFKDYRGIIRKEVRLAWWNAGAKSWPEATLSVPDPSELPTGKIPSDAAVEIYSAHAPPVLVGHYKMTGDPSIAHEKAASIDYPDTRCIYHWSGGDRLSQDKLQTI